MNRFHGTGVALVTPFNADGSVDYTGLKNLINYQIEGQVEYLVSLGTTGESATLNKEEKKKIWAYTAEINNGRLPLIAGIGGNDTASVVDTIKNFDTAGYDCILSASPYYNKPSQEGIYQHYKAISDVSHLPILLYNVPGRTASNMSAETTCRLAADFKNIIGIKEASGNFEQFNQIMRDKPADFLLISGDDPITLPMIALGASGLISVVGNALPAAVSQLVRLCLQGDFSSALPLHLRLIELTRLAFAEGNPAGIKAALKHFNVCGDQVRLPLVSATTGLNEQIIAELNRIS
ncbi:dihydrodipicolinate synthase [Pedobacter antarcticus 4BY]|uniref:4-hydroxy-tetrahydrodipicolinate synthase n=2 Tax=Pedobacter antarcticus TaxID=34086 RepID=A0A081PH99_9SPHI|nr:4-hydroxy-tetrahydrodipicolinate synthase [Pedobacter antarcticus]KEQ30072.1 dihydrodipicolinate synthase [Pedobacter antarcticus 4BY]SFF39355.1 4-hydroxy-tetrahydrodipicolinate synthase [Pedobacter antarcticus]